MQRVKLILIIAFTAGILSWLGAWWMIAVAAFVVTVVHNQKPSEGFKSGFAGVALLWTVILLWRDVPNEHILLIRMAALLGLPNGILFALLTIILGGLIGGLAGWSGGMMNKAFRKEKD